MTTIPPGLRIAIAGEFNSGKSSVVNLLFRQRLLPMTAQPSNGPIISARASREQHYLLICHDGSDGDVDAFVSGGLCEAELAAIELEAQCDALNGATVIEIPLTLDNLIESDGLEALGEVDVLIWCTMAQRAWSLSEISVVENLPPELVSRSILAVTRTDLLNDHTRGLVRDRLEGQAGPIFGDIVFLDSGRHSIGRAGEEAAWRASGGPQLLSAIAASAIQGATRGPDMCTDRKHPATNQYDESRTESEVEQWTRVLDELSDRISATESVHDDEIASFLYGRMTEILPSAPERIGSFISILANVADAKPVNADGAATGLENHENNTRLLVDLFLQLEEDSMVRAPECRDQAALQDPQRGAPNVNAL